MELSNWAPEHSDALRELIAKGMSLFGSRASHQFTIQYVLLSQCRARARPAPEAGGRTIARQPSMPTKPVDLHDIAEPRPSRFQGGLRFPGRRRCSKRSSRSSCAALAIEPRHLSLIELERGDCRYPYGGDEEGEAITFCGHPRRPGSSYCTPAFSSEPRSGRAADCSEHRFAAGGGGGMKNAAVTLRGRQAETAAAPPSDRSSACADRTSAGGLRPPGRIVRIAARGDIGRINRIGLQPNRAAGRNRIPLFSRSPSDAESQTPKAVQSRQGT